MKAKILSFLLLLAVSANLLAQTAPSSSGGGGGAPSPREGASNSHTIGPLYVERVWEPGNQLILPNTRVPFLQIKITSGTTEPLQYLRLDSLGNADFGNVFKRIIATDGGSRTIASVEKSALLEENPVILQFTDTVLLANEPLYITIAGEAGTEVSLRPEAGKIIGLKVSEVALGNWSNPSMSIRYDNLIGATHTVNANFQVGRILSIRRVGEPEIQKVGAGRLLGGLRFDTSSIENISCLPSFKIHTAGGAWNDIQNLTMVSENGDFTMPLTVTESPMFGGTITVEPVKHISLPKGGITFYFHGDIGNTFAGGGSIAVSTTPSAWRSTRGEQYSYDITATEMGTIVGPTMTIKGARLDVRIEAPGNQIVTSGHTATVLTIVLDATESTEDVVVTEFPLQFMTLLVEWKSDIYIRLVDASNDQIVFGGYSPASYEDRSALFIRDRLALNYPKGIVVPKGTKKEILVRASFSPEAEGVYAFAVVQDRPSVLGVQSRYSVVPSITYGWSIFRAVRKG